MTDIAGLSGADLDALVEKIRLREHEAAQKQAMQKLDPYMWKDLCVEAAASGKSAKRALDRKRAEVEELLAEAGWERVGRAASPEPEDSRAAHGWWSSVGAAVAAIRHPSMQMEKLKSELANSPRPTIEVTAAMYDTADGRALIRRMIGDAEQVLVSMGQIDALRADIAQHEEILRRFGFERKADEV